MLRLRVHLARHGLHLREQRRRVRRGKVQRPVQCLLLPVLERPARFGVAHSSRCSVRRVAFWQDAISHHGDVPVETVPRLWDWQSLLILRRSRDPCLTPGQLLGGVFGLDHWSAQIPAALDVQAHLQPEPVRFAQRVLVEFAPFGRKKSRTMRHRIVAVLLRAAGVANQSATEAFGFHLFQVARDGHLGHVAVEPPPIGAQAGTVRRIGKAALKRVAFPRRARTTPSPNC